MMRSFFAAVLAGLLLLSAKAVETETWRQSSFDEFAAGKRERIALGSDGRLMLSPELKELLDTSADAIWSLVHDGSGNVYTAAPSNESGKLNIFRISASGVSERVAEIPGLACFALTVDAKGRVYAGVSPDARIFRVENGSTELYTQLPAAYIWSLAFDSKQDLFAATGDKGVIYKIDQAGKASVFLETDETHVRSLLVDNQDRIYAGTAPNGLVMRVSPTGEPFVVYQAAREEITSIALSRNHELFLAATGAKRGTVSRVPAAAPAPQVQPPTPPAPASPSAPTANPSASAAPAPARAVPVAARPAAAGGAEVMRINAEGFPETVWSSERDIVYALTVDSNDRIVLGTGNEGELIRLEGDRVYTSLLKAPVEQITALLALPDGGIVFSTANVGKVHKAGPLLAESATFESDVFDSEFFARWGRVSVEGKADHGSVTVQVRSGNVNRPQKTWSAWSSGIGVGAGSSVNIPPARYAQWRAELKRSEQPVELRAVELAYRRKNTPPRILATEATPPNYMFPPRLLAITPSDKITLQPLSSRNRPRSSPLPLGASSSLSMQYAKGYVGVRWEAEDPERDELSYSLEIRRVGSSNWLPLVKDLKEPQYSWDSNAWPDGRYEVQITASDRESNIPEEALERTAVTDAFVIDNAKPAVQSLAVKRVAGGAEVTWRALDELTPIRQAHFSVNGKDWTRVEPENGLSDSTSLDYLLRLPEADAVPGAVIAVRVSDEFANEAVASIVIPTR